MPSKYRSIIITPVLAVILICGLAFYLTGFAPQLDWKIITIVLLTLLMLVVPLYRSLKQAQDVKQNIPIEDEMSRKLEIYAGAYAFRYSMMSWFAIFVIRDQFPDTEEMLGIGIMAAAAIYGLSWLYFRLRGLPDAEQN